MSKLRIIKDYEKLSQDLKEQVKLVYPEGFSQHLIEFHNAKGEIVSALPFETDDKIYLLKMSVRTALQIIEDDDDYDDEGNLFEHVREKYEDEYADVNYLSENDKYHLDDDDEAESADDADEFDVGLSKKLDDDDDDDAGEEDL
jgi:hypothetical protein